jgi:hypothetical protein
MNRAAARVKMTRSRREVSLSRDANRADHLAPFLSFVANSLLGRKPSYYRPSYYGRLYLSPNKRRDTMAITLPRGEAGRFDHFP